MLLWRLFCLHHSSFQQENLKCQIFCQHRRSECGDRFPNLRRVFFGEQRRHCACLGVLHSAQLSDSAIEPNLQHLCQCLQRVAPFQRANPLHLWREQGTQRVSRVPSERRRTQNAVFPVVPGEHGFHQRQSCGVRKAVGIRFGQR